MKNKFTAVRDFLIRDMISGSAVIVLGNDRNHDDKRDFAKDACFLLME